MEESKCILCKRIFEKKKSLTNHLRWCDNSKYLDYQLKFREIIYPWKL